ncbi:MAG: ribonuclease M5 [Bacillaceae bacterium]|nr:ribonuclease M5 [Bacillaceae bacterium]
MYIKEVIVVEGKDDTVNIKRAVQCDTIETNGSAIDEHILEQIRHAQEKRGVIVFTDPDYPGQRIRHIITEAVPGCKHAFLPREQAKGKNGLGVEHASPEDIRRALEKVYEVMEEPASVFTRQDLLDYGLIGGENAKRRREKLGIKLNIGFSNAKQLEKRLNMFRISKKDFQLAMDEIIQEEINHE